MRLEHSFEVGVPVERAWDVLLDVEKIAPCMPGATLSEFDGDSFTGTVRVKLGPVSLTYKGKGKFVERDEATRRVVIKASGQDSRGAGAAGATVTAQLYPAESASATRVDVVTELDISGRAAQFGRGMIGDVSSKLLGQFVDCLSAKLAVDAPAAATATAAHAAQSSTAPASAPSAEPEAVDLLAVSGASAAKRIGPYVLGVVVLGLVIWGLIAWLG